MVLLSEELVLSKTRADDLAEVKNLNLWGSDLSDVSILQVTLCMILLCSRWDSFLNVCYSCERECLLSMRTL